MNEKSNRTGNCWPVSVAGVAAILAVCALCWSWEHPYGTSWDESQYLNEAAVDTQRLRAGQILRLGGRWLLKSWGRPPAYRILAAPLLGLFGFHPAVARIESLICFALSVAFIYLLTKRIANASAGAIAALIFSLSPVVVSAISWYGSEGPLYLATSAMLYYLCRIWTDSPHLETERGSWIGLGLAVGLGLLAKTSFILIGLPVLIFAWGQSLMASRRHPEARSTSAPLLRATALAFMMAVPWWALNFRSAREYAEYARGFARDSVGQPSLATWWRWSVSVVRGGLGEPASILIALILVAFIWNWVRHKRPARDRSRMLTVCACFVAGVPIVLVQITGTNQLLRHVSPAIIPFSVLIGAAAATTGWTRSRIRNGVAASLLGLQLAMIVSPILIPNRRLVSSGMVNGPLPWTVFIRHDQWNWDGLKRISDDCGLENPRIAILGGGRTFDIASVQYPWVLDGIFPEVVWLWRYEGGPIDWQMIMASADKSDIVITAPGYVGEIANKEDLDNQYNAELAGRLAQDSRFRQPIQIAMGRFTPANLAIFVRRDAVCRIPPLQSSATGAASLMR